jgi:hypothetical protein
MLAGGSAAAAGWMVANIARRAKLLIIVRRTKVMFIDYVRFGS